MDEGLVAVEQAVPTGQQVACEPALALIFTQHLHHPAGRREELVAGQRFWIPLALRHLEQRAPSVRYELIRYSRGRITVLDRAGLQSLSCECCAIVKKEYDRLLPDQTAV